VGWFGFGFFFFVWVGWVVVRGSRRHRRRKNPEADKNGALPGGRAENRMVAFVFKGNPLFLGKGDHWEMAKHAYFYTMGFGGIGENRCL